MGKYVGSPRYRRYFGKYAGWCVGVDNYGILMVAAPSTADEVINYVIHKTKAYVNKSYAGAASGMATYRDNLCLLRQDLKQYGLL